ncbi:MAG: hypothetical protein KKI08_08870 [Armatimonadetes bacterium]|nr:hypothetical protein [Armatimonadota bacterium]
MLAIILGVIWIILMLYLGSGLWATVRGRGRSLTERDYRKGGREREASEHSLPDDDPLLVSLDLALLDGFAIEEARASGSGTASGRAEDREQCGSPSDRPDGNHSEVAHD